jgi:hypothetical protein
MKKLILQILLALVLLTLAFAISLVLGLAIYSQLPAPADPIDQWEVMVFAIVFLVAGIGLALAFAYRVRRPNAAKPLLGLTVLVAPFIVWLAWDEPVTEQLPPPPQPARWKESAAVVSRYWRLDGVPPARRFPVPQVRFGVDPVAADEWRLFLVKNREPIVAEWAARGDLRQWFVDLDAFAAIGDYPSARGFYYGERTDPLEYTVYLHCAYVSLLAIDGRGDEALAVLQTALSVCRKLQPAARIVERFFTAHRMQRVCQQAARFVLKVSAPSPPALQAFAAMLDSGNDQAAQWRQFIRARCEDALAGSAKPDWGFAGVPLVFRPFLVPFAILRRCQSNPGATANLTIREYARLAAEAGEGRGEGVRATVAMIERELATPVFKNAFGRRNALMRVQIIDVPIKRFRLVDAERRALLAEVQKRLAAPEGATPPVK